MRKLGFFISIFALVQSNQSFAVTDVAGSILQAFSSQCPATVPRQTQQALASVTGLYNLVSDLQSRETCTGSHEVAHVLSSYQRAYENYLAYQNSNYNRLENEKTISGYTSLLNDPSLSADEVTYLQDQIFSAQASLISMEAESQRFRDMAGDDAIIAAQLMFTVQGFMENISLAPQCMEGKSKWLSLVSNSLTATSLFAAPGTALGLAAGGVLLQGINKYIKNYDNAIDLADIDAVRMPQALSCVSEAMTTEYCNARNTMVLVEKYLRDLGQEQRSLAGLDLISRHMKYLDKWLKEVYGGSPITSQGDLVNREKPILQSEFLEKVIRYLKAYQIIRARDFANLEEGAERTDAIALSVQNMLAILYGPTLSPVFGNGNVQTGNGPNVENPIFTNRQPFLLAYRWLDPDLREVPRCAPNPGDDITSDTPFCGSLPQYVRFKQKTLGLEDWNIAVGRAVAVVEDVLDDVNTQRAQAVSVDSYRILVAANRNLRGETNAYDGILMIQENAKRIADYLYELADKESYYQYESQIKDTMRTYELALQVGKLMEMGFNPDSYDESQLPPHCVPDEGTKTALSDADEVESKSFVITSCISKVLKLAERGNDVFFSKVRSMVAYEVEARLAQGELGDEVDDVVRTTREDLVESLVKTYQSEQQELTLEQVYDGLDSARELSRRTLDAFFDTFRSRTIETLTSSSVSSREKARLCFRALPYLKNSDQSFMKKIFDGCQHSRLGFFFDGPELVWGDYVKKVVHSNWLGRKKYRYVLVEEFDQDDRYCAYDRYNKRNLIIQRQLSEKSEL